MRAVSTTPVGPKWSREGSADGDKEWGPSECVRRSQKRSDFTPIDSGSDGVLEQVVKEEIKIEVSSPRVERPSSPPVSDEDPLSDRALQSLVKEEKLRCRSPSPSEDFMGFTEVDRDSSCFNSNVKRNLLLGCSPDSQDSTQVFPEGVLIKGQRLVINYRDVDGLDDGNIFCDLCCRDRDGECPVHGPLNVIPDAKARPGIGDAERDLKTLPSSLSSGQSRNPASGNGVFAENDLPARQRLGPYEGILTTEQGQARTTGYRWQIKKGHLVHHSVNAEDPSCSNWLRRVNCARSEEEQNLVAFQYRGQIYFRTSKPIPRGSELLVYYGDDSARELTVHSETSGQSVTSSPAGPSSSGISGSVQCPHCDFRCLGQQHLDRHVKRCHKCIDRNGRFKCERCHYSTDESENMNRHRKTHTGERPHRCDICDKTFAQRCHLTIHNRIHTGQRPYKCDVCGKSFRRSCDLSRHVTVHTGEKPYQCEKRDATFSHLSSCESHMKVQKSVKEYGCHECPPRFTRPSNLQDHVKTHTGERPFGCSTCPERFTERSALKIHMQTHAGQRLFGCPLCTARFTFRCNLTRHMRTHTGERPYSCSLCTARFIQQSHLDIHMQTHSGERLHSCSLCTARFVQRSHIIRHMRTHTGERPHCCSICSARFTQLSHLTAHMRTHTGERPFGCPNCTARFTQRSHLTTHIRTHTKERPYGCSLCTARFTRGSHLNIHMRTHTGERPYGCSICQARFADRSTLISHLGNHTEELRSNAE
ncbi:histone-lysine N-methyltransferase PRDM9-like [Amphibalanus amphitrite]|uniref:histone-lysine N-methyltransferase PRDM9-like n=1 Tax=Amphibalanus amphitrite TaxID=1232801 RepID=UPI001C91240E|nr:histone-lysine N-methyltransferase PRDM9-like [Amphibalanus amphitrite]XP_043228154.1 histone-lysine N-methyltransferase PRDM9-like [Amphibalanus amphitrite]